MGNQLWYYVTCWPEFHNYYAHVFGWVEWVCYSGTSR